VRFLTRITLLALLAAAVSSAALAEEVNPGLDRGPGLAERIAAGLEARRPEDFAFAEQVAALVTEGRLPVRVVDSAFLWAREHAEGYAFPHFRRVVTLQARRLGIRL
jgi:hypothetical protein